MNSSKRIKILLFFNQIKYLNLKMFFLKRIFDLFELNK